jgi:hypothetical protein
MTWHGSATTWTAVAEDVGVEVVAGPPPAAGVDDTEVDADVEHADRHSSAAARTVIHV